MQYYYGVIPVNHRYLMHANAEVKGYWRVLNGVRTYVEPYTRKIVGGAKQIGRIGKGIGSGVSKGFNIGRSGKRVAFTNTDNSFGGRLGRAAVNVGNTAGRAALNARNTAGRAATNVRNAYSEAKERARRAKIAAKSGYELGKNERINYKISTLRPNGYAAMAGYAAGRAAKNINKAASKAKEWGKSQISKAGEFISNMFNNAKSKAPGIARQAVDNLKSIGGKALEAGKNFMTLVFGAVDKARKDISQGYSEGRSGKVSRQMMNYAKKHGGADNERITAARSVGYEVGSAVRGVGNAISNATKKKKKSSSSSSSSTYTIQKKRMF